MPPRPNGSKEVLGVKALNYSKMVKPMIFKDDEDDGQTSTNETLSEDEIGTSISVEKNSTTPLDSLQGQTAVVQHILTEAIRETDR